MLISKRVAENTVSLLLLVFTISVSAQNKTPEDFGFRHIIFKYKTDDVDILVKSKKGEENKPKPVFFFCQGSLPKPLIKYDEHGGYGVFPFNTDSLESKYHLVIVGKPCIPVITHLSQLDKSLNYKDSTGRFPKNYAERNLLSYYVPRNNAVISYLLKQGWVSSNRLVVAGHSEGSTVAAKMATDNKKITHVIYASGNPMGRIMSMIAQKRFEETDTDSTRFAEEEIAYWKYVTDHRNSINGVYGDTPKTTYEFSEPPIRYLEKLKMPVLVSYGTKDWSALFNDFMRVEFIRQGKSNFTFHPYVGTEHNFFQVAPNNQPDYSIHNWDKVANDWLK